MACSSLVRRSSARSSSSADDSARFSASRVTLRSASSSCSSASHLASCASHFCLPAATDSKARVNSSLDSRASRLASSSCSWSKEISASSFLIRTRITVSVCARSFLSRVMVSLSCSSFSARSSFSRSSCCFDETICRLRTSIAENEEPSANSRASVAGSTSTAADRTRGLASTRMHLEANSSDVEVS